MFFTLDLSCPLGWLIIGAFSFFYLRSIHLGGIYGATAGVTSGIASTILNFHDYFNHISSLYILFYVVGGILYSAALYAVPGIIGGWLYERKQTKN